jgi:hypothetical protein
MLSPVVAVWRCLLSVDKCIAAAKGAKRNGASGPTGPRRIIRRPTSVQSHCDLVSYVSIDERRQGWRRVSA